MFLNRLFLFLFLQYFVRIIKCNDCDDGPKVVCYWGSWSVYRKELGKFQVENINPKLCTTIVYTFIGLDSNLEVTSLDPRVDFQMSGFKNFTDLKAENPCLKTTLAIGGWNEGSLKYSVVASSEERRKKFANSILNLLSYYNFDGIDLDWEYPGSRGGLTSDRVNYVELLRTVKNTISPWNFKLAVAIPFQHDFLDKGYDLVEISKIVDFIHFMAYDYVSSSSSVTGLSAPFSIIKNTIPELLNRGVPSQKIILGIQGYGHSFKLKNQDEHGIGAPVRGLGMPGYFTDQAGFLAYHEVLDALSTGMKIVTEDGTKYAYDDDEWITYDDEDTIKLKVKYAVDVKLGGIMFWSIDLDDFIGRYQKKYPLLTAINQALDRTYLN